MAVRMYVQIFDDGPVSPHVLEGPAPDPSHIILAEEICRLYREYGDGVVVHRYWLGTEPGKYMDHPQVAALLRERGPAVLPVTLVDGRVVRTGVYPCYGELEPLPLDEAGLLHTWERALGNIR